MKKKIALLIFVVLMLTMVLSACNSTEATKIIPRWKSGESYVYNITLCDFAEEDSATYFKQYDHEKEKYFKDFVVRVDEAFENVDEVRPKSVTGEFTLTITSKKVNNVEYDVVETRQQLTATYDAKDGKIQVGKEQWVELPAELASCATTTSTLITFNSTIETIVEFKHDATQAPVKSSTKVDGFYVGKVHQEKSDYEVTTTYTYESKSTVVNTVRTISGEREEISETLKRRTEGSFIDSNQLFMYARSLDKTSGSFQDNPNVIVYNPFTQMTDTVSFSFTSSVNAVLTNGDEELFTQLPTVGVVVGGIPFMLQENAPNFLEREGSPDSAYFGEFPYAKHTPVRFRVGNFSYELKSYDDELWNALHLPKEEEQSEQNSAE